MRNLLARAPVALLALAALGVSACASSKAAPEADSEAMGPSMNSRRFATLQKIAAKDLKCPVEQLEHEYLGNNQHAMTGCQTNGVYELRCMMGSCVWIPDVRTRAEFDMGCPRLQIQVIEIDKSTRGATGCGKRATYKMSPMDGSWILNSVAVDQPQESAPAPTVSGGTL